jgi:prepilin-type N-terminal cleavage/methylation domain-containing protein
MPLLKSSIVDSRSTIVKSGFTLIELLVVISIIGVLVAGGTFAFNNARDKARDSTRKQDLGAIKGALTLYFEDNSTYPYDTSDPTKTDYISDEPVPWIPNLVPTYIKVLPIDLRQSISGFTGTYVYVVPTGASGEPKKEYVLWAQLENTSDPDIYSEPNAPCKKSPPSVEYNYCLEPEF